MTPQTMLFFLPLNHLLVKGTATTMGGPGSRDPRLREGLKCTTGC